jgi:hypothetical protein
MSCSAVLQLVCVCVCGCGCGCGCVCVCVCADVVVLFARHLQCRRPILCPPGVGVVEGAAVHSNSLLHYGDMVPWWEVEQPVLALEHSTK